MSPPPFPTKRMLGIDFFVGTAAEAIAHISKYGGLIVAPAAPSFIALQDDPDYRRAIGDADLAIADSGWAVLFWRLLRCENLTRISGLPLFKALLETADARIPGNLFWILPSENAKTKTLEFGRASGYPISGDDCYVAPNYQKSEIRDQRSDVVGQAFLPASAGQRQPGMVALQTAKSPVVEDPKLVSMIEQRKPKHIIIGIGGGKQDKLGSYLKHLLTYRPRIYYIGAAPGFVTGDLLIPMWADRFFVGWIFRIIGRPRDYLTRYSEARLLPLLIIKYGTRIPQLRTS